jgi:BioD-like phosphotransacetylase family protein
MKLREIKDILDAEVLCGDEFLEREVFAVCGSDLMSDVLAFAKAHSMLLTGLINQQVIRTAEMIDIECICFVRDKKPDASILELALEKGVITMTTPHLMFEASGLLYCAGIKKEN